MENAVSIDGDAFMEAIQMNMTEEELSELLLSLMSDSDAGYDNNLRTLGYADPDQPGGIDIYPLNFEGKEEILNILDNYNRQMEDSGQEEKQITYTDLVGTLMSSVTDIIDVISYVLIAFVAISLVVSSIMIGVITYISVLERRKEIGILRAIGASKHNVSQVFNAETFIIGLCAGLLGIGITLLLLIPGNSLIHSIAGRSDINAILPAVPAVILVALSVVLTLIGGLIPSRKAAKSDPVAALKVRVEKGKKESANEENRRDLSEIRGYFKKRTDPGNGMYRAHCPGLCGSKGKADAGLSAGAGAGMGQRQHPLKILIL